MIEWTGNRTLSEVFEEEYQILREKYNKEQEKSLQIDKLNQIYNENYEN